MEIQKGSPSSATIILALLLAVAVCSIMMSIKGSRDACKLDGGTPRAMECVKPEKTP